MSAGFSPHIYIILGPTVTLFFHISLYVSQVVSGFPGPFVSEHFTSPHTRDMFRPPHTARSEHGHDSKTRAKSIRLHVTWHYHETSSPLGPNIRFSILFSQLSVQALILRVTDQVSQFFKNRSAVVSTLTLYSNGTEFISWLEHRLFTFLMIFLNLSEQTPV